MRSKWSQTKAEELISQYAPEWGRDLALRTYTARLLGSEPSLVLHGGGNTSVKGVAANILGEELRVIWVKASGFDLAQIEPQGHPAVDLTYLERLRALDSLSDEEMVQEIRSHLQDYRAATPSIETLVHAFIPRKFIDHTHADAILTLTNQQNGRDLVREALGDAVSIIDYVTPGFKLAKATSEAFEQQPDRQGMVWMRHGILTWGETAREAYEAMTALVSKAEDYMATRTTPGRSVVVAAHLEVARQRWKKVAPILRGALSEPTEDSDRPYAPVILAHLIDRETLGFVNSEEGRKLAQTPPLTADHLIRTKPFPLSVGELDWNDLSACKESLRSAVESFRAEYRSYVQRHTSELERGIELFEASPRVALIPGLGAVCAARNIEEAQICRDITAQTLVVKAQIASMGEYEGLDEGELFAMEYRGLQHSKLRSDLLPLEGRVALVTGAAGAIGAGICRVLLESGCHVAVTDLPGERLDDLGEELRAQFGEHALGVPLDVTDPGSVANGFELVSEQWGGVDLVVVNAGAALVSSLGEMKPEEFRRLERINVEGTLSLLSEAARHLELQGIGGDIVLISTKNVFAPGARFGAYSATKAAAHQLARIASLELAGIGVRVNMVSPDAVFGEGKRKSGLWAEVGPDRMKARGLDEESLQEYYRSRNLLKARVTPRHVGNAVLYFATRQTPTTGATIPVDGGLPDATPR